MEIDPASASRSGPASAAAAGPSAAAAGASAAPIRLVERPVCDLSDVKLYISPDAAVAADVPDLKEDEALRGYSICAIVQRGAKTQRRDLSMTYYPEYVCRPHRAV